MIYFSNNMVRDSTVGAAKFFSLSKHFKLDALFFKLKYRSFC
jgi:hypothetical protein